MSQLSLNFLNSRDRKSIPKTIEFLEKRIFKAAYRYLSSYT